MGEFRVIAAIFVGKGNNEVTLFRQRLVPEARCYFLFDLVDHLSLQWHVILREINLAASVRQKRKPDDQKKDAEVHDRGLAGYVFIGKRSSWNGVLFSCKSRAVC
jgi:hypothetical protein